MAKPRPSDIPQIVYDNLRAVHESRVWRIIDAAHRDEFNVPRLSNAAIFDMMPDRTDLMWGEEDQPYIMGTTLRRMFATVEFPN